MRILSFALRCSAQAALATVAVLAALAQSAPAQRQLEELRKVHLPVANDTTQPLAFGDVDGDGDLDLVVGNYSQQSRLYLNDGTGIFSDATAGRMPAAAGDETTSLALGDVDGDGDLDLLVGDFRGESRRLLLNLLRHFDAPHVLRVGYGYRLDVYARGGPFRLIDVALPYLSTATVRIPLPPLGTVGIDPRFLLPLPPQIVPQPAGVASLSLTVPNVPALIGISVYGQALLIQYPTLDRLTNVTSDAILR